MHNRLVPAMLCTAAIIFACAPRPHIAESALTVPVATHHAPVRHVKAEKGKKEPPPPPSFASTLVVHPAASDVDFDLRLTNVGEHSFELAFPSGRTHDIAVLDSTGREVWRWSKGRLFTQTEQRNLLDPRETASYGGRWDSEGRHGTFTAVATLATSNYPVEQRAVFRLP